ncbi:MAG: methyl-accepting chemotaxis protein [Desulfatiglandaceae bacterium]|jgi:methyl-accepting chemotaxis protein
MKINTKIMLMVTFALVFSSLVVGAMAFWQLKSNSAASISQIKKLGEASIEQLKNQGTREINTYREDTIKAKKALMRSVVETAYSFLERANQDAKAMLEEGLTEEVKKAILAEAQENIAGFVGKLRYGLKNKDYFWINDMQPRMIMDPYHPKLKGEDLSNIKDPKGKKVFVEMVKVCGTEGQGFVDYYWPKYGSDKPFPKISFVKLFKPWDWVIGTGSYLDDVEAAVKVRQAALNTKVKAIQGQIAGLVKENAAHAGQKIEQVIRWVAVVILFTVLLALLFSLWFTRRNITRPVNHIVEELNEGADQVATGSNQVSSASQALAEGASEQAASIQQTSSSLEEMAAMTRQNAENAGQANMLMQEANRVVGDAKQAMGKLTGSMEDISKASEETQKIIKTIDEIAFQTNLLALNAAVEAARAGEAGAGFAVVADEVRNLAMRTAEAARNTAELIKGTVRKIKDGSALVGETNKAFTGVSGSTSKVGELVAEIAAASREQANGIEQLNDAVNLMDQVVQKNAASAEESASASEEMNAQAENMKGVVLQLVVLAGGRRNGRGHHDLIENRKRASLQGRPTPSPLEQGQTKTLSGRDNDRGDPEQVIPMEDDFQDF